MAPSQLRESFSPLLTLSACAMVTVIVLSVCVSVTELDAAYLVYTLKVRYY